MAAPSAGYDISPAHSDAAAQATNQAAGVLINFGSGSSLDGGWFDQTARTTATATASKGPATSQVSDDSEMSGQPPGPNWVLIGTIAGAAVLIAAVVIYKS